MKKLQKSLLLGLSFALAIGNISPIFASVEDTIQITQSQEGTTEVFYNQASTFSVTVPKKVTLDADKTSAYDVTVEGDVSSDEMVYVIPEKEFEMKDISSITNKKDPVIATVTQDKEKWKFNEFETIGNGLISAPNVTAGNWEGSFFFNIALRKNYINVIAKNEAGEDLNASSSLITGNLKEELLDSLVQSGLVDSKDDVDAIIDVESDNFDGLADTEFDVSNIAKPGDKVTILHYDETKQEWEYIGTETVDENGKISGNFTSYSPIVFVKQEQDGSLTHVHNYTVLSNTATCIKDGVKTYGCNCNSTYTENVTAPGHQFVNEICTVCGESEKILPGLYDSKGNLLCKWENSGIDPTRKFSTTQDVRKSSLSAYNIIGTKYPSCTKIVLPEGITTIAQYAFAECLTLRDVVISEGVTTISDGAFYLCNNMNGSIVIPTSVKTIGKYAFYGPQLSRVYYRGTSAQWNSISKGTANNGLTDASITYNYTD